MLHSMVFCDIVCCLSMVTEMLNKTVMWRFKRLDNNFILGMIFFNLIDDVGYTMHNQNGWERWEISIFVLKGGMGRDPLLAAFVVPDSLPARSKKERVGGEAYSFVAGLSHSTIDHASLSRGGFWRMAGYARS